MMLSRLFRTTPTLVPVPFDRDPESVFECSIDVPVEEVNLIELQTQDTRPIHPFVTATVGDPMPVEE